MTILQKFLLVSLLLACKVCDSLSQELTKNPCDSEIYCQGPLLHTVQMSAIFPDSKTFVDMQMKTGPTEVLANFAEFMRLHQNFPSRDDVEKWVHENFNRTGSEFEDWKPQDHKDNLKIVAKIKDESFKKFAVDLNQIWLELGRKMKQDVADNPQRYSIIYVKNGVIVPGGRFLEFYYWDSYWIILGLIHSEMLHTAKGMLENFLSIINRYNFVPNGGRLYYLMRSQPPLLSMMIKEYVDASNDLEFAKSNVALLEREFNWFMDTHIVEEKGYKMAFYNGYNLNISTGPRPESYREDYNMAQEKFRSEQQRQDFYSEIKAAAESGMDFSSRWFMNPNDDWSNKAGLEDAKTRSIIPVELNAILYRNAKIIAEFYELAGNREKVEIFEKHADNFYRVVNEVLWNEDQGSWSDYNMINKKHRNFFVVTNLAPLFYKSFDEKNAKKISDKVMKYIEKEELDSDKFPGGVPNTLESTGEQWDYPNVWPCMQHMLIVGLQNLGQKSSIEMAEKWAQKWVFSNYVAYNESKAMFEKYLANEVGGHGGGGEYEVQKGFGWTNGVIFDLLNRYGDKLSASEKGFSDFHS